MHILTKEQLLSASGRKSAVVDVPELGGKVRLLEPSSACILRVRALRAGKTQLPAVGDSEGPPPTPEVIGLGDNVELDVFRQLISSSVVDAANKPLFTLETIDSFLESIPIEVAGKLVGEINKLMVDEKEPTEGNPSVASASAA